MSLYSYPLLDIPRLRERTTQGFREQLVAGAHAHGYNPDYLAAVMSVESGFRPGIRNLGGAPAAGLIQFWRSYFKPVCTRAGMDVSWEQMQKLSATAQLPLVFAYYDGTRLRELGSSATAGDYYMATFMPALIGADKSALLGQVDGIGKSASKLSLAKVYAQNKGLDRDKDGSITVGDVELTVERVVAKALTAPRIATPIVPYLKGQTLKDSSGTGRRFLYLAMAGAGGALLYKALK